MPPSSPQPPQLPEDAGQESPTAVEPSISEPVQTGQLSVQETEGEIQDIEGWGKDQQAPVDEPMAQAEPGQNDLPAAPPRTPEESPPTPESPELRRRRRRLVFTDRRRSARLLAKSQNRWRSGYASPEDD